MFRKTVIAGMTTLALGLGFSMAAPVSAANAGSLELRLNSHDGHLRIKGGQRRDRGYHVNRGRDHGRIHRHHICRPGHALYKAERRGVRHARIDRVGNRFVVVKGRKRGGKIKLAFYRDSKRCEVAWVKRKSNRHHYGYRY